MKRSLINAKLKSYVCYEEEDEPTVEFKKHFLKFKKHGTPLPENITLLNSKPGYVGSGNWDYEMNGNTFSVSGFANGRGFWGTDYLIVKM